MKPNGTSNFAASLSKSLPPDVPTRLEPRATRSWLSVTGVMGDPLTGKCPYPDREGALTSPYPSDGGFCLRKGPIK